MREYARKSPRAWTGRTGQAARRMGQTYQLALHYLMDGDATNMYGLFYLPPVTLAYNINCTPEEAEEALLWLQDQGFCMYDPVETYVFVIKTAEIQIGETLKKGDNRVVGIQKWVEQNKHSPFIHEFLSRYADLFHITSPFEAPSKPLSESTDQELEAPSKPLRSPLKGEKRTQKPLRRGLPNQATDPSKPLRSQEQEQEQEKEQEVEEARAGAPPAASTQAELEWTYPHDDGPPGFEPINWQPKPESKEAIHRMCLGLADDPEFFEACRLEFVNWMLRDKFKLDRWEGKFITDIQRKWKKSEPDRRKRKATDPEPSCDYNRVMGGFNE